MPFFADTNICDKWESDPVVHKNWLETKIRLESLDHEYVSCSLVLIELLSRLAKPEPKYFSKDLNSFTFLSNQDKARFLPYAGKFALRQILDIDNPVSPFDPSDFKQWVRIVTSAQSREALTDVTVEVGSKMISYGLDFSLIKSQHEQGRLFFAQRMTTMRDAKTLPTIEEQAAGFLQSQGILPKPGDIGLISAGLDAAFLFERTLLQTEPSYDFYAEKHRGDWIDSQLLYYLADKNMYFLTNDRRLKSRCASSKQSEQIIVV